MKKTLLLLINQLKQSSFFETFTNISTYFSAQVAIQALGIVSLPVYTYFLDEKEYGIVNVYLMYASVFSVLLGANLYGAISRYYYEEKEDFKNFMGTTVVCTSIVFGLSCLTLYYFRAPLAALINLPEQVIVWLLGFSVITAVFNIFEKIHIPQKKSKLFSLTQVAMQYAKFIGAIIGLYLVKENIYMGKISGELIAMSVILIFLVYKIAPYVKAHFSWEHVKYIAHYSLPLVPYIMSGYILHSFDTWYINSKLGNEDAGLYVFAYKIGILLAGFTAALLSGANPNYYSWMNQKAYGKVNEQVISLMKLLTIAAAFLVLFAIDLGTILASREGFYEALPLVPIIIGGYFFFGITSFYNRAIFFEKKNIYLTYIVLGAGAINIFLNWYYIPIYGYQAAAFTTLVSYFFMSLFSYMTTNFVLKLPPLPLTRILQCALYLGVLVTIYYLYFDGMTIGIFSILQKGFVFLVFAGIVYYQNLLKLKSIN